MLDRPDEIELALVWVLGAVVALGTLLPPIAQLLGLGRHSFTDVPETPEPAAAAKDPVYRNYVGQLEQLGFEPLGVCLERQVFTGPSWFWTVRLCVFGARQRECFACLVPVSMRAPPGVALATCLDDGSLVWTSNFAVGPEWEEPDYVRAIAVTNNLQQLVHLHRRPVEQFRAAGRKPEDHGRLATLLTALTRRAATERQYARPLAAKWLRLALIFQAGFPLLVAWQADWHPLAVPVAILIGAALYWTYWASELAEIKLQRVNEYREAGEEEEVTG